MTAARPTLEVRDLHVYYGESHALQGVSLTVREGEIVALLGRNGAGKTTTIRGILGLTPPRAGRVLLDGRDVAGRPVHENVRAGMAWVPEDRRIFPGLTVEENLEVATLPPRGEVAWTAERVFAEFPLLAPLRRRRGGALSGGQQQLLAIARALCGNPRVLLLDEPSEGLAPLIVRELGEAVRRLKGTLPVLLAEQNARFAVALCDRGVVLEKGQVRFEGTRAELQADPEIQDRYLSV
ncbi:MAG TPA: ABC transporter ATP-binding protein [Anaeromyxobacter sp.]|nr:ABC transporter ATP-binding protein [Anaeromyxobacter sp.]